MVNDLAAPWQAGQKAQNGTSQIVEGLPAIGGLVELGEKGIGRDDRLDHNGTRSPEDV